MKTIIIGGGAGGMLAALRASQLPGCTVTVLERQARVGKKLLATGNGRCNLTNLHADPSHYHGQDAAFCSYALSRFGAEDARAFFRSLGLLTVSEADGKVYPLSDSANSVVDVLRFALDAAGVTVECGCEVTGVRKKARGYAVDTADGRSFFADKLIVACGGCAGAKLGGTKDGYRILTSLGHHASALTPSLVQVRTETDFVRPLKGVRADAQVILKINGKKVQSESGEIQFTDFGVSGPTIFALSREIAAENGEKVLLFDFLKDHTKDELFALLQQKRSVFPALSAQELLAGILHPRLGKSVLKASGICGELSIGELSDEALLSVCDKTKCLALTVLGTLDFDHAQVTAGGILCSEFDPKTLESRLCPNLFAAGEVLDIDGDCGGYNLQWAWASGYLAGSLGFTEEKL